MEIGLTQEGRKEIVSALHRILANQHVFYMKLRNFHWNVKGKEFFELHAFYEEMYTGLSNDIDEVAERIQSLGSNTIATMSEYVQLADIQESPDTYPDSNSMTKELLKDSETIIRGLRTAANTCADKADTGTEDMLIGFMKTHEKQAWMLRSFLN